MIDPSLQELAEAVQRGERIAEVRLVERLAPVVRNIVRAALRQRDFAMVEDLSQDVLWEIVQRLRSNTVNDITRLDHFVCRMARNMAIDVWRDRARQPVSEELDTVWGRDPLHELVREDALRAVRLIVASMQTARDRQILLGVYFHDVPKKRLCEQLKVDAEHFDRVLHRARGRLLELLARQHSHGLED